MENSNNGKDNATYTSNTEPNTQNMNTLILLRSKLSIWLFASLLLNIHVCLTCGSQLLLHFSFLGRIFYILLFQCSNIFLYVFYISLIRSLPDVLCAILIFQSANTLLSIRRPATRRDFHVDWPVQHRTTRYLTFIEYHCFFRAARENVYICISFAKRSVHSVNCLIHCRCNALNMELNENENCRTTTKSENRNKSQKTYREPNASRKSIEKEQRKLFKKAHIQYSAGLDLFLL